MIRIIPKTRLASCLILVAVLTHSAAQAEVAENQTQQPQVTDQEVKCLAKNIYYESRGEPQEGQIAVGIVTLNRVEHEAYPKTVCGVVNHKIKTREGKLVCQFSWVCKFKSLPAATDPVWTDAVNIAKNLMLGKYQELQKKYDAAHHFHSAAISPKWRLRKVAQVGSHIFYQ